MFVYFMYIPKFEREKLNSAKNKNKEKATRKKVTKRKNCEKNEKNRNERKHLRFSSFSFLKYKVSVAKVVAIRKGRTNICYLRKHLD